MIHQPSGGVHHHIICVIIIDVIIITKGYNLRVIIGVMQPSGDHHHIITKGYNLRLLTHAIKMQGFK